MKDSKAASFVPGPFDPASPAAEDGGLERPDALVSPAPKRPAWHAGASAVYAINAYPNGITLSIHSPDGECAADSLSSILPEQFHLRLRDTRDYMLPSGRYYLYKEAFQQALEKHLSQLYKQEKISSTVVYFGTVTDPFLSFQKKFEVTMACLELFEHYRPGLLVIQARSPMVIAALPTLRLLGAKAVVTIPLESPHESVTARYAPNQPRIAERLVAAEGLRRQGVKVNLAASPILPYGDYTRDAAPFAELLCAYSDFVTLGSLAFGGERAEHQLKNLALAQKLVADRHLHWLRPQSYLKVLEALGQLAPEKLVLPGIGQAKNTQLSLFAA